jgi:hypothetical protein
MISWVASQQLALQEFVRINDSFYILLERFLNLKMEAVCFTETPKTMNIGLFTLGFEFWILNVNNLFSDINVLSLSELIQELIWYFTSRQNESYDGIFLSQIQSQVHFVTLENKRNAIPPDETDSCPSAIFIQRTRYGEEL